ncbi:MAG: chromosome segregation protein SMC, partial [Gallionellaceae bacterium]|nr:chromosome segregation protein SMC [Gallionellaceae bacterium]
PIPLRLKHIHLAGFKSFVDPVTIPAPARLTGIVGPNGCGKSNVIDAVRWVLGESKARELRGESMQDVIFNGSANRKPASRASVEMLFDNAEGRAQGQWSQYAEIAVKRQLTRTGESSYYINNMQVRRKDIYDLFLGTGLGGDAYAIIEQGMISRVIESKPEELRGYLEEAAGVSKYKERRRETERRLADTRENLARVDDIRAEMEGQLERLAAQAEVARRYFALNEEKTLKEGLLALLRKRDAQVRQQRLGQDIVQARNAIEAGIADLRRLESEMETARLDQFATTEAVNQAQAHFYAEGGEATRLEQSLRHLKETRERLVIELARAIERIEQARQELEELAAQGEQCQMDGEAARELYETLMEESRATATRLPELEAALEGASRAVLEKQRELSALEHQAQVELTHRQHAERNMEQLKARQTRLSQEQSALGTATPQHLARLEEDVEAASQRLELVRDELDDLRAGFPALERKRRDAADRVDESSRALHKLEAELGALKRLQDQASRAEQEGQSWLMRQGLGECRRLWQVIRVEAGWEDAAEAALRERLAALLTENQTDWLAAPPEGRLDLALPRAGAAAPAAEVGLPRLAERIRTLDPLAERMLADWLALVYAAPDLNTAVAARARLPAGGVIATPQGHLVGRDAITYNAPDKGHHGLLKRARDIEVLSVRLKEAEALHDEMHEIADDAEEQILEARRDMERLQAAVNQAQDELHQRQLVLTKESETVKRLEERRRQLADDLAELAEQLAEEAMTREEAEARYQEAKLQQEFARELLDAARDGRREQEATVAALREQLRRQEREAQEAGFRVKSLATRFQDLGERRQRLSLTLAELDRNEQELREQLGGQDESAIQAEVQAALERRRAAELALVAAREAMEGANERLRQMEQQRIQTERNLEPLRANLQGLELKLQEAHLKEEQFAEQLAERDEAALAEVLTPAHRDSALAADIGRLGGEIDALGAVNMAALQELEAAQARKNYLDAQATDLTTAADTLEEAIRRIDAESRARLRATYDSVSTGFRRYFTELFGGGEAELILTGEEILDAGLVVMAQPPGKKNSSIHLLSGGEKALTAIALVFAFFSLNPAPFCLLDEVDAPLDDSNTERLCRLVTKMSEETQFMFITHNRITMEMALHLVGITMPEPGVSRPVAVDVEDAVRLAEAA